MHTSSSSSSTTTPWSVMVPCIFCCCFCSLGGRECGCMGCSSIFSLFCCLCQLSATTSVFSSCDYTLVSHGSLQFCLCSVGGISSLLSGGWLFCLCSVGGISSLWMEDGYFSSRSAFVVSVLTALPLLCPCRWCSCLPQPFRWIPCWLPHLMDLIASLLAWRQGRGEEQLTVPTVLKRIFP